MQSPPFPPLPRPSSVQIFFSTPCSQTPSAYFPPAMSATKFVGSNTVYNQYIALSMDYVRYCHSLHVWKHKRYVLLSPYTGLGFAPVFMEQPWISWPGVRTIRFSRGNKFSFQRVVAACGTHTSLFRTC